MNKPINKPPGEGEGRPLDEVLDGRRTWLLEVVRADLGPTETRVFLAVWAHPGQRVSMSMLELARLVRRSEKHVRLAVEGLVARQFLEARGVELCARWPDKPPTAAEVPTWLH